MQKLAIGTLVGFGALVLAGAPSADGRLVAPRPDQLAKLENTASGGADGEQATSAVPEVPADERVLAAYADRGLVGYAERLLANRGPIARARPSHRYYYALALLEAGRLDAAGQELKGVIAACKASNRCPVWLVGAATARTELLARHQRGDVETERVRVDGETLIALVP